MICFFVENSSNTTDKAQLQNIATKKQERQLKHHNKKSGEEDGDRTRNIHRDRVVL